VRLHSDVTSKTAETPSAKIARAAHIKKGKKLATKPRRAGHGSAAKKGHVAVSSHPAGAAGGAKGKGHATTVPQAAIN
jgi:hypothetical protein